VQSIAKRQGAPDGPPSSMSEIVETAMAEILAPPEKRKKPASTSIASIDELLAGGVYPGEYVILGARPSVGKTAFALQIARLLAKQGTGVLIASLEMTRNAITRRMLAQEAQVRAKSLKTGDLVDLEKQMLTLAAMKLRQYPIWITSDVRTTDQLEEALLAFTPGMLGMVIVDYLQLMQTAEWMRDQRQRVEAVSKAFRRITVKNELPLIALSSLSRPPKNVREWEPSLADLRESGELEHDADHVWLLHRLLGEELTKFKVAKNRDGEVTGQEDLPLLFNGSIQTFTEAK
jgi:replicative DNA helicase